MLWILLPKLSKIEGKKMIRYSSNLIAFANIRPMCTQQGMHQVSLYSPTSSQGITQNSLGMFGMANNVTSITFGAKVGLQTHFAKYLCF